MKRLLVFAVPLSIAATIAFLLAGGCATLKTGHSIFLTKEYERMLAGPPDADYVGNDKCLKSCHDHDAKALVLQESLHGHQKEEKTGMPLVNCETCHGPGSLAIAHAAENKKCDVSQLVNLTDLPPEAQSFLCLRCHSSYSLTNLQFWPASKHALGGVSCADCHQLHKERSQKMSGGAINETCLECHYSVKMELSNFSRHPILEGKMNCATCHEPHGSRNEKECKGFDEKELCLSCHGEKIGPFTYEHADLTEDCSTCHVSHGSPFGQLLRIGETFLCLECHSGHTDKHDYDSPPAGMKQAFYTRCTNCHSQVHGTDGTPTLNHLNFTE